MLNNIWEQRKKEHKVEMINELVLEFNQQIYVN